VSKVFIYILGILSVIAWQAGLAYLNSPQPEPPAYLMPVIADPLPSVSAERIEIGAVLSLPMSDEISSGVHPTEPATEKGGDPKSTSSEAEPSPEITPDETRTGGATPSTDQVAINPLSPRLILLTRSDCPPCVKTIEMLNQLVRDKGYKWGEHFEKREDYTTSVPVLIGMRDGKEVIRLVGLPSWNELIKILNVTFYGQKP
jgi:thiol-disulfide isomerase/thioredoxin